VLQRHCKGVAASLQRCCSITAKVLQHHCKGVAVSLQKECSNFAVAIQCRFSRYLSFSHAAIACIPSIVLRN